MKSNKYQIITPSASLKTNKINKLIDTECLFGETFNVLYSKGSFSYGVSDVDRYEGWVKSNSLDFSITTNYVVARTRTIVLSKPTVKSQLIFFLHMRSKINVVEIIDNWAKISLLHKSKIKYGYIFKSHILKKNNFQFDWIKYAECFVGVPYRWGGRNSIGLDCSALLQLSIAFKGEIIPRDTKDQIKFFSRSKNYNVFEFSLSLNLNRGNIIFWDGHVAIILDNNRLIHASGAHNEVIIEKIKVTIARIKKWSKLVIEV